MKIIVIVVTYNGIEWINKCFSSLLLSTIPLNIFAIDNASSDNTVLEIKNKFPEVELIQLERNLGFGKANNIGLRKVVSENAEYVFLLNQDAYVNPDTIEKLVHAAELKDNFYGLLSPVHFNYIGDNLENYFYEYVLKFYTPEFNGKYNFLNSTKIYETTFVNAAAWLIPLSTIKLVGGFDPIYEHTGEDNDYIQRLLFRNLRAGILSDSIIYHFGTNDGLHLQNKNNRYKRNEVLLKLKNEKSTNLGALVLFFKNQFTAILSGIKLTKREEISILKFGLKNLPFVWKARIKQKSDYAFLGK